MSTPASLEALQTPDVLERDIFLGGFPHTINLILCDNAMSLMKNNEKKLLKGVVEYLLRI